MLFALIIDTCYGMNRGVRALPKTGARAAKGCALRVAPLGERMLRIVHYQNHFFGQSGQGEHIGMAPVAKPGPVGPGNVFADELAEVGELVATIVCGDDYMLLNMEQAIGQVVRLLEDLRADALVAGPAFNAGRYGLACGAVCKAATERLGIPAVTGMYPENPGVEQYVADVFIVETASSIVGMRDAVPAMASMLLAMFTKDADAVAAARLTGIPGTSLDMSVQAAPALPDVGKARLALVTEGGLVPMDNPDLLESSNAKGYYRYSLENVSQLAFGTFKTVHGGVDRTVVNASPERLLPLSAVRNLVARGKIGSVASYFFSTTGNGTSVEQSRAMGRTMAEELRADGVDGVLLTAT